MNFILALAKETLKLFKNDMKGRYSSFLDINIFVRTKRYACGVPSNFLKYMIYNGMH